MREIRFKCTYCKSKHRSSFMHIFDNNDELKTVKVVCNECVCEYRKIFFSPKNPEKEEQKENPLFKAFERGWRDEEELSGLQPLEIPKQIKDYYDKLWINKVEKQYQFNKIKRIIKDQERDV